MSGIKACTVSVLLLWATAAMSGCALMPLTNGDVVVTDQAHGNCPPRHDCRSSGAEDR